VDTKLFARIGAGAFVAVALTMTALQLREEPKAAPTETITVLEPDEDRLPAQLRACSAMGELAVSSPDCRAAWAEKRQRFLGIETGASPSQPAFEASDGVPPTAESQSEKGQ
jgi:conjugative transfer region protein TrbK